MAQTLQLLNAGRLASFLQGAQTLPALEKLVEHSGAGGARKAGRFAEAYDFLRDVEHRLQMEDNLQTHTIPEARPARELAGGVDGFRDVEGVCRKRH